MSLSGHRQVHVYLAIRAVHEESQISLRLLCEVARVPRSSNYKWVNLKPSQREQENKQLTEVILALHEQVLGICVYQRHTVQLCRDTNKSINYKRIRRLMKLAGWQVYSRSSIGRKRTTHVQHPSLLQRTW